MCWVHCKSVEKTILLLGEELPHQKLSKASAESLSAHVYLHNISHKQGKSASFYVKWPLLCQQTRSHQSPLFGRIRRPIGHIGLALMIGTAESFQHLACPSRMCFNKL